MLPTGFTALSILFFFAYWSPYLALCMVFDSILSNIEEVLLINLSANMFVFWDFNVHHEDWLSYSGGTDGSGELCYIFSVSNDLTQMVNFCTRVCDSRSPAHVDLFLSSGASICSAMAFSPVIYSDNVVVSVSIDFPSNSFFHITYDYSGADWNSLHEHLRDMGRYL